LLIGSDKWFCTQLGRSRWRPSRNAKVGGRGLCWSSLPCEPHSQKHRHLAVRLMAVADAPCCLARVVSASSILVCHKSTPSCRRWELKFLEVKERVSSTATDWTSLLRLGQRPSFRWLSWLYVLLDTVMDSCDQKMTMTTTMPIRAGVLAPLLPPKHLERGDVKSEGVRHEAETLTLKLDSYLLGTGGFGGCWRFRCRECGVRRTRCMRHVKAQTHAECFCMTDAGFHLPFLHNCLEQRPAFRDVALHASLFLTVSDSGFQLPLVGAQLQSADAHE
jgi:hypothetical protein